MITFPENVKFTAPAPDIVELQVSPGDVHGDFNEITSGLRLWVAGLTRSDFQALTAVVGQTGWKLDATFGVVLECYATTPQGAKLERCGPIERVSCFFETVARRTVLPAVAP